MTFSQELDRENNQLMLLTNVLLVGYPVCLSLVLLL